jgi:hypothetical protein
MNRVLIALMIVALTMQNHHDDHHDDHWDEFGPGPEPKTQSKPKFYPSSVVINGKYGPPKGHGMINGYVPDNKYLYKSAV